MKITDFHTVGHADAKKMHLYKPDGKVSKAYIMILGADSAPVRAAKADGYRVIISAKDKDVAKFEAQDVMRAAMIDSWSFDEECTQDEKLDLLKKAPYIGDAIDLFSGNHGNFKQKK